MPLLSAATVTLVCKEWHALFWEHNDASLVISGRVIQRLARRGGKITFTTEPDNSVIERDILELPQMVQNNVRNVKLGKPVNLKEWSRCGIIFDQCRALKLEFKHYIASSIEYSGSLTAMFPKLQRVSGVIGPGHLVLFERLPSTVDASQCTCFYDAPYNEPLPAELHLARNLKIVLSFHDKARAFVSRFATAQIERSIFVETDAWIGFEEHTPEETLKEMARVWLDIAEMRVVKELQMIEHLVGHGQTGCILSALENVHRARDRKRTVYASMRLTVQLFRPDPNFDLATDKLIAVEYERRLRSHGVTLKVEYEE